jgi:hypothetical protein
MKLKIRKTREPGRRSRVIAPQQGDCLLLIGHYAKLKALGRSPPQPPKG